MSKLIVVLFMLAFSRAIGAADGNYLLSHCIYTVNYLDTKDAALITEHSYSIPYCAGFIESSRETLSQIRIIIDDDRFNACIPAEVTNAQLTRTVVSYLKKRPDILHKSAGLVSMLALMEAFPCTKNEK